MEREGAIMRVSKEGSMDKKYIIPMEQWKIKDEYGRLLDEKKERIIKERIDKYVEGREVMIAIDLEDFNRFLSRNKGVFIARVFEGENAQLQAVLVKMSNENVFILTEAIGGCKTDDFIENPLVAKNAYIGIGLNNNLETKMRRTLLYDKVVTIDFGISADWVSKFPPELKHPFLQMLYAGETSTTRLQRTMGIGYPKAARYIDLLEEIGLIESTDQGRKFAITIDEFVARIDEIK